MYVILITIFLVKEILANDNLQVAYRWKMLNFAFPSDNKRLQALQTKQFIPENNFPLGFEVYGDRLFVNIPRWKDGVVASLAYMKLSEATQDSPLLYPYPSWAAHKLKSVDNPPQIVSASCIRADRCNRLWILDTGYYQFKDKKGKHLVKPRLLIYDLDGDQLLCSYVIPEDQAHENARGFASIAVEDNDCNNSFAYLADLRHPAMVVYSYQKQKSWLVKHPSFHANPKASNMSVAGLDFQWKRGLFSLALSGPDLEGYSMLYYHPFTSFDEFVVSTRVLHDENLSANQTTNFTEFKKLGSRGPKGQSGASFFDPKSKVLFFASVNNNALSCWKTTNYNYEESHSTIFVNNETMIFPNDIEVDANHTLWVLSNKLPVFVYSHLDYSKYNFIILKGKVSDVTDNTPCEFKLHYKEERERNDFLTGYGSSSTKSLHYHILSILTIFIILFLK